ncbi:MAG: phosphoribosylglycinamide formyltransferase [Bacteroidaceae bacterium]
MSIKIAIMASGSGSNAENIALYFKKKRSAEIAFILSNKENAYVLERAKKLNIRSVVFSKQEFEQSDQLIDLFKKEEIDFIVLAGFLLRVPDNLLRAYPNKIVNIHPALLPKFGGKGMYGDIVHEAVVAAGETQSGITIHYINAEYDSGSIIFQATCPVLASDTAADVAAKVHQLEYQYYPQIIEKLIL